MTDPRKLALSLLTIAFLAPGWAAAIAPLEAPGISLAGHEAALPLPEAPSLCALAGCLDLPLMVDEHGDTMTGDLTMDADVVFNATRGIAFPGGFLAGDGALAFGGVPVCLAASLVAGCGDISAVRPGVGLLGGAEAGDAELSVDTAAIQARVAGVCAPGFAIRAIDGAGAVACEQDDDTTYGAGAGLALEGTTFRVMGCDAPQVLKAGALQDWACGEDLDTTYSAGDGLLLAGTTFAVATGGVTSAMVADGSIALADLAFVPGDITDVVAGNGLTGGASSGSATLAVDTAKVCMANSPGPGCMTAGWLLTGNAGSSPGTNFLGTSDNKPLEFRTNGQRVLLISNHASPNILAGSSANLVTGSFSGATIAGGGQSGSPNTATGQFASIGGGRGNTASSHAVVGGGSGNAATADAAVVAGGLTNTASGLRSFVGGGDENRASGSRAAVVGGVLNVASDDQAFVGAGAGNVASGRWSVIAGGYYNAATQYDSVVGGGSFNAASQHHATVAGGERNTASGAYASVGGGSGHAASLDWATIAGGKENRATNFHASVGGGLNNLASGVSSTAAGGVDNVAGAIYATVGGGRANTARLEAGTVAGGANNDAAGEYASIGGGFDHRAGGQYAVVVGGSRNNASGAASAVLGGSSNLAQGSHSIAAGRAAQALHSGSFVWADNLGNTFDSTAANTFRVRATGGVAFMTNQAGTVGATLAPGSGTWSSASDRALKADFAEVDAREVLAKVAALPLSEWSYLAQGADVRHVGPMAQDFRAAFGLGEGERHISGVDADGVALAAIQGLWLELEEERARNDALEARLAALEATQGSAP